MGLEGEVREMGETKIKELVMRVKRTKKRISNVSPLLARVDDVARIWIRRRRKDKEKEK